MNSELIVELREHAQEMIAYVQTLNTDHIHTSPPSGGWSIIQICDHLMSVEYGIYRLMGSGGTPADPDRESKIEKIRSVAEDRNRKAVAPAAVMPKGKTDTIEKFITSYPSLREKIIIAIENKDLTPVSPFPHIVFKEMSFEEWLIFIIHHANRHKDQMAEVLGELANV